RSPCTPSGSARGSCDRAGAGNRWPTATQPGPLAAPGSARAGASRTGRPSRRSRRCGSTARRQRGRRLALDLHLAVLVEERGVEVDEVAPVLLALGGDGDLGLERLARPRLLGEAHLVLGEAADADVVSDGLGQEASG